MGEKGKDAIYKSEMASTEEKVDKKLFSDLKV
jgi:hypothetical protein